MGFIAIYVAHKDMNEAKKIAEHLIKNKFIACVNYFPMKSSNWWKGNIEDSEEIVTILKTKKENWEKVKSEIKNIHSYETPCIMKFDVEANEDYESWIKSECL
jgi:periplasmic divalent cation tolerance protein